VPRYFFTIRDEYRTHLDAIDFESADLEGARGYADRVIRELREDDAYNDPRLVMFVMDEKGRVLFSLRFLQVH
jgi:hypothetical protein